MKVLKILLLLILCFLTSCAKKKMEFVVENKLATIIDSVRVSSSGTNYTKTSIISKIKENEIVDVILDMENIPKSDGNYKVEVFYALTNKTEVFGYYSNGYPSSTYYKIIVSNDSIHITEHLK